MTTKLKSFEDYRRSARRTQNMRLTEPEALNHALYGIASEAGELTAVMDCSLNADGYIDEAGDLLWFLAEYCDIMAIANVNMQTPDVMSYAGGAVYVKDQRLTLQAAISRYCGMLCGAHQKIYQGHTLTLKDQRDLVEKLIGVIEAAYKRRCSDGDITDIYDFNVKKLQKRYPYGFDEERSVNR